MLLRLSTRVRVKKRETEKGNAFAAKKMFTEIFNSEIHAFDGVLGNYVKC